MKRRMMWMAAMIVLLGGTAFGEKGSYVVDLPTFGEMGLAVDSLELQLTDYGFTATNLWTPAEGALSTNGLVDSVALKVNLKPGYKNARFDYYTEAFGDQESVTGMISNGSAVPFYTAQTLTGGTVALATYVTNLTYEAMTFSLNFDARGGNVEPSYLTVTYDQPYGTLPMPQRAGYAFKGWWADGREWKGTETVRTLTNQTFTAAWEPIRYTVRFLPGEGSGTMADQNFVYDEKQKLSPCAFTRDNFQFTSWSNTVSGASYPNAAELSNLTQEADAVVTLVAQWTAKTYEIRYHRNYGEDLYTGQGITFGEATTLATDLGRTGYSFGGWAKASTASVADFSANAMVSTRDFAFNEEGVFDLWAVWKAFSYTVQFAANGGSGTMDEMTRTYDDGISLNACTFTRPGFTFAGWSTTAAGAVAWPDGSVANLASQKDGEVVKLYAVWTPVRYTVAFVANDEKATGEMAPLSLTYGTTQKLPACAFEKDGYMFAGWACTADGEVAFADGAEVGNLTDAPGAEVQLFACWKAEPYRVTLDANGGVFGLSEKGPTTSNILVTVDATYGEFPFVTNHTPKLVFGDWRTPSGEVVRSTDTVPPPSAGVTNLVAHWVKDDPLARATDANELDFDSSATNGSGQWLLAEDETAENGTAACATMNAGVVEGTVQMTTKVVGPGQLTFNWKALSVSKPWTSGTTANIWSKTAERLYFQQGSTYLWGIAGNSSLFYRFSNFSGETPAAMDKQTSNPGWIEETLRIDAQPGETNTLTWTFSYVVDDPTAGHAWVDNVRWVPDAVEVTNVVVTVPPVANYTASVVVAGTPQSLTDGACEVPSGSTVKVVYQAAEGYEPATVEIDLGVVTEDTSVPAEQVPAEPTLKQLTVTVPEVANCTAVVVADGVTNAVENGACVVSYGATVTVVYQAMEGYEPAAQEVALGKVTAETTVPADQVPEAPTLKQLTVTVPDVANCTAVVVADGVTNAVENGACVVSYGATVTVVYQAAAGFEPATQEVALGKVTAETTVPAEQVPAAPTRQQFAVTVPFVANYTAVVVADGVTNVVENGVCNVPYGADVTVVYQAAPGYEPAVKEIPLGSVTGAVEVPAEDVPDEPVLTAVTVVVPSVAGATAAVVVDGVTNVVENGQVLLPFGAEGAKIVYLPQEGVTLEGPAEVALPSPLEASVEVPAEDVPAVGGVAFQIVVASLEKAFGADDPTFTWQVLNPVSGLALPEGRCERVAGEAPGEYEIDFVCTALPTEPACTVVVTKGVLTIKDVEMPTASGKVTYPKTVTAGKSATWKATPANGSVFVTWTASDAAGETALAAVKESALVKTSISVKAVEGMTTNSLVAVWKRLDEDVPAGKAALMTWSDETVGTVSKSVLVAVGKKSSVKATPLKGYVFAGWYTDLTFLTPFAFTDGKDFREAGHSVPVNENTYLFARFVEKSTATDPVTDIAYVGTDRAEAARLTDTWFVGVAVTNLGVTFGSASKPTVKVSGLPSGVKWNTKAQQIVGVPTKAGEFNVTIAVKNASAATAQVMPAITVVALPDWAQGTFNGVRLASDGTADSQVTLTVSKAGKISGKVLTPEATYTLVAPSFARVEENGGRTNYVADVELKNGKVLLGTYALAFQAAEEGLSISLARGFDGADEEAQLVLSLLQNAWKRTDLVKAKVLPVVKKAIVVTGDALGQPAFKFTFKDKGAVSVAGMWNDVKVSGTAQLLLEPAWTAAGGEGTVVVFIKSTKTFPGFVRVVPVRLTAADNLVTGVEIEDDAR